MSDGENPQADEQPSAETEPGPNESGDGSPPGEPATEVKIDAGDGGEPSRDEQTLLDAINSYRQENDKPPFAYSAEISAIAEPHTAALADKSIEFSTEGSEDRAAKLPNARRVSETVGYNRGYPEPIPRFVEAWKNDEVATRNLLGDYTHVGIAIRKAEDHTYYSTVLFVKN
jgi:uncharacterized protein YkwD